MYLYLPRRSYEEYLSEWCGLPISTSPPRIPEEYYWMILVGESPSSNYEELPRRPLGYYLSILAGMPYEESVEDEYYWCVLTGESITVPLPRRPLEYYLMNYVPSGFRFRIDVQGMGILFGEAPLPNFTLNESTGVLTYSDDVAGSPPISDISLSSNGMVLLEE